MKLSDFYDEDPRRRASEEVEFGRGWTDGDQTCFLSWVSDTGELYATFENQGLASALLGFIGASGGQPFWEPMGFELLDVEVLAVILERADVEAVLEGWQDVVGRDGSLIWLRQRIRRSS